MNLKRLIHIKIIKSFFDNGMIYLQTDSEVYKLEPYGECCAVCFIQHIESSDILNDSIIVDVDDIELKELEQEEHDGDIVEIWGHRIITTKGICTIEMRVDHNGYYGGSLDLSITTKVPDTAKLLEDF
jgi:hypothetical protein